MAGEDVDALAASGGTDADTQTPDVGITDDDRGGADEAEFAFAAAQGWVPKAKWKGDPAEWADAKSFAEKGRSINALLRESNKRLERELTTLKDDVGVFKAFTEKEHKAKIDALETRLKAQRTQAVADGDGDAFARAEAGLEKLAEARAAPKSVVPQVDPQHVAAAETWQDKNSWYGEDRGKTALANSVTVQIVEENPALKGDVPAVLKELDVRLAKQYPELFAVKKPNGQSRVEDGAPGNGSDTSRTRKLGFKDMPKEAQQQAQRMVDRKMLKTVDDYVKNYDFGGQR